MALYRVEALILRHMVLGEADKVLTVLTPSHGKLRLVARGVRRPKSQLLGSTQLFSHSRFLVFQGRSLDGISQAELCDAFGPLREDLLRMAHASYAAELIDRLVEERQPDAELFGLVLAAWRALAGVPRDGLEAVGHWLEIHLMANLGYRPHLEGCVACGRPLPAKVVNSAAVRVRFSSREGGLLCSRCAPRDPSALRLSGLGIGRLQQLLAAGSGELSRLRWPPSEASLEARRAVEQYVADRVPSRLKSAAFLDGLRAEARDPQ